MSLSFAHTVPHAGTCAETLSELQMQSIAHRSTEVHGCFGGNFTEATSIAGSGVSAKSPGYMSLAEALFRADRTQHFVDQVLPPIHGQVTFVSRRQGGPADLLQAPAGCSLL